MDRLMLVRHRQEVYEWPPVDQVAAVPAPGCNDHDAKPVDFFRLVGKIEIELQHAGETGRRRYQLK
jgi:hypothetical protein